MARTAKGGLSKHPVKGFRITIGKKPDGKPKLFWLGQDRRAAERRAGVLKDQFTRMRSQSRTTWTAEDIALVDRVVAYLAREEQRTFQQIDEAMAGLEETRRELEQDRSEAEVMFGPAPVTPPATTEVVEAQPMLHAMIDRYVKYIEGERDKSDATKVRLRECMDAAKHYHPNIDVARLNRLWIDEMCQFWRNLPSNRKTRKPIRSRTAKTVLGYLLQFFKWMSDNEAATGFVEPKRMTSLNPSLCCRCCARSARASR